MDWTIVKAGPGIDPEGRLAERLGPGFRVREFEEHAALAEQVADADVLLVRNVPVTRDVIDRASKLKLIQRMGAHLTDVDVAYARQKGIHVARIPASPLSSRMLAEHALFLIMALAKHLKESQQSVAAGRLGSPHTDGIKGKRLGIVGLGRSGTELARLAAALGMSVAGVRRTPDPKLREELGLDFLGAMDERDALLARCDYVSIHVPLNAETRDSFSESAFAAMRRGSRLINVARAAIVHRPSLERALDAGQISGAAFDVFWDEPADPADPLLQRPDFLLTPHIGGFTVEARERLIGTTADNILRVAKGEEPQHLVPSR